MRGQRTRRGDTPLPPGEPKSRADRPSAKNVTALARAGPDLGFEQILSKAADRLGRHTDAVRATLGLVFLIDPKTIIEVVQSRNGNGVGG